MQEGSDTSKHAGRRDQQGEGTAHVFINRSSVVRRRAARCAQQHRSDGGRYGSPRASKICSSQVYHSSGLFTYSSRTASTS